ncbi:hypothetical protein AD953_05975 [Acetobacter malorum]|uniref:Uncharacterized protein n=2 Tax=Acetobacter malorum TaxID=178901 RepID=A0A149V6R1_9PROT|nr:hypothetical protein AD953_05975 [Acetobacter malorum]
MAMTDALVKITTLRAQRDQLLAHAKDLDASTEQCAATNNTEGASAWRRLANLARSEAHWLNFRATVLSDSINTLGEPRKCA